MQRQHPVLPWSQVRSRFERGSILIGNGASRVIWEKFAYSSLFERACSDDIANPLDADDRALFASLGTSNFERVLHGLRIAQHVDGALGFADAVESQRKRYQSIQRALAQAVRDVHVPWPLIADSDVLVKMREALGTYGKIYSTNYDLLVYWASMTPPRLKDFFWNSGQDSQYFDRKHADASGTQVLYLHGALHLFVRSTETTHKRVNTTDLGNLLSQFGTPLQPDDIPLILTEGTSDAKRESIKSNDYLSFAHETLARDTSPLVIFGHSLDEVADAHIIDAIKERGRGPARAIAVSVYAQDPNHQDYCARIDQSLGQVELFDSASHPLGDRTLRVG